MKNYLKIVVGAIIIGGFMAYLFYKDIKKEVVAITNTENIAYIFQVGVFKSLENAQNFAKDFSSGEIYQDKDLYRVIIAITLSNKEKLEAYFKSTNINYYIKEITLKDNTKIKEYDALLSQTDKKEVIDSLNKTSVALFLSLET